NQPIRIVGWAVSPNTHDVPLDAWISFTSPGMEKTMPIRHRLFRPDVAKSLATMAYITAGFTITIPPGQLAPGDWHMHVNYRAGQQEYACDNNSRLTIKETGNP
ncbi:MAG TPA: hypothetical protein VLC91_12250, partial [Spongiibacteraceae bacterium]|nr:hypothetical protein [Spongiibacteraceae bacterium]